MSKEYARAFYNSVAWKQCREAYRVSVHHLCEQCGGPGYYVHHKVHLTPRNIHNPRVTLSFDNLRLLCASCHKNAHCDGYAVSDGLTFDEGGNLIRRERE